MNCDRDMGENSHSVTGEEQILGYRQGAVTQTQNRSRYTAKVKGYGQRRRSGTVTETKEMNSDRDKGEEQ